MVPLRRSRTAAPLLITLLASSGCSVTRIAGDRWVEARGSGIRVLSNTDDAKTALLVGDLEAFPAVLEQATGSRVRDERVPLEVFAFESGASYAPFAPNELIVGFYKRRFEHTYIALRGDLKEWREVLYHELVHRLLRASGRVYPSWYEEGLAEFVRTVHLADGKAELGRPPPRVGLFFLREEGGGPRVHPAVSESIDARELKLDMDYAFGWAMVSYITVGHAVGSGRDHRPDLSRYLDLLQDGRPDAEAFRQAFGTDLPEFRKRVARYVAREDFPRLIVPLRPASAAAANSPFTVLSKPVPESRVAAALGKLSEVLNRREQASEFYLHAHRLDASEPDSLRWLGWQKALAGDFPEARNLFERALRVAEDDPWLHVSFGYCLLRQASMEKERPKRRAYSEEARTHFSRATVLEPAAASAQLGLGESCLVACPDLEEGISAAEQAAELVRGDAQIELRLGQLYGVAGNRSEARYHFEKVLRLSSDARYQQAAREALAALKGDAP